MKFKLNRKGGSEVLKTLAAAEVAALARKITDAAGEDAQMATYTTDRAAASVMVWAAAQAKDGRLTRAASAAGLEVKPK